MNRLAVIAILAILFAGGVLMNILACALYNNW